MGEVKRLVAAVVEEDALVAVLEEEVEVVVAQEEAGARRSLAALIQ